MYLCSTSLVYCIIWVLLFRMYIRSLLTKILIILKMCVSLLFCHLRDWNFSSADLPTRRDVTPLLYLLAKLQGTRSLIISIIYFAPVNKDYPFYGNILYLCVYSWWTPFRLICFSPVYFSWPSTLNRKIKRGSVFVSWRILKDESTNSTLLRSNRMGVYELL